MKFVITLLLLLSLSGCTSLSKVEKVAQLKWNYEYSSNVIHATYIKHVTESSNRGKCKITYSKFKVIESFKGNLKKGDIFSATGISAHDFHNKGTEHFLLLNPFVAKNFPGYGNCSNEYNSRLLNIHNWCCPIKEHNGEKSFVMYKMINSEVAGKRFFVPVTETFLHLRKLNSSNKLLHRKTNSLALAVFR